MYKIKFIPTGHVFVIPEKDAKLLKEQSPQEYLILEKNGKKFKDKNQTTKIYDNNNLILSKVLDK